MVFNYALTGAGPRQQLVLLRRLMAEGIRPAGVLVEVLPAILYQPAVFNEDASLKRRHMQAEELAIRDHLPARVRYPSLPAPSEWVSHWYASRFRVLRRFVPTWVESEKPKRNYEVCFSPWGWFNGGVKPKTGDRCQQALDHARKNYKNWLAHWQVSDIADQAIRELLTTCHREQMPVAVYLMPEGSPFREWYRPEVRAELDTYLTRICREHDAELLDTTLWSDDGEFLDGHHLFAEGATPFSKRFGRELLEPFAAKLSGPDRLSQQPTNERR